MSKEEKEKKEKTKGTANMPVYVKFEVPEELQSTSLEALDLATQIFEINGDDLSRVWCTK